MTHRVLFLAGLAADERGHDAATSVPLVAVLEDGEPPRRAAPGAGGLGAALRLDWRHRWFCIGCWALTLLMFAVGVASRGWVLLLAMVMALEKNAPWGRRVCRPLGMLLLATGIGLAARGWL